MKKPIDIALSNKIKQTLENYQPEFKPEYWAEFERKRKKNAKTLFLFWPLVAKAAVFVLLFSGIPSRMNQGTYPEKIWIEQTQTSSVNETIITAEYKSLKADLSPVEAKMATKESGNREIFLTAALAPKAIRIENNKRDDLKFVQVENSTEPSQLETTLAYFETQKSPASEDKMLISFDLSSAAGSQQQTSATMMESTIAASVPVGKKWLVSTGLRWQKNSENSNVQLNLSSTADMSMKINEHANYQSISLPLSFQFKLKKNILIGMGSSVDYVNEVNLNKTASLPAFTQVNQMNGESSLKQSNLVSNNFESTMEINHLQFFNHLRFGLSYQWQTSKRAMQFEPFMQLPLSTELYLSKIPMIGLNIKYQWKIG